MKRTKIAFAALAFVCFVAAAWAASGELMSVQVKSGQLRANPSFLADIVAPVAYGDRVQVLQKQVDWMEVTGGGKKGWIHQSALTKKQVVIGSGGGASGTGASSGEVALAGKGFNPQVEANYRASNRNADFASVDRMEQSVVSPMEMASFIKEGRLEVRTGGAK